MMLQGRLFDEQLFPSPTDEKSPFFKAKSRCLIQMNDGCFLVFTEGENLKPHQRSLHRLEVPESQIAFADNSHLSTDECKKQLEQFFGTLPHCSVVGVEFPFFAREEVLEGFRKTRPCVALYGQPGTPPLYLGAFMGAPRNNHKPSKFEILLRPREDLLPPTAPETVVDCTKLCSFPEFYDCPGDPFFNGNPTYTDWYVVPNERAKKNVLAASNVVPKVCTTNNTLKPSNPQKLRKAIVDKLLNLLVHSPHMDYVDTTLKYDIGEMVTFTKVKDGEVCKGKRIYAAPLD